MEKEVKAAFEKFYATGETVTVTLGVLGSNGLLRDDLINDILDQPCYDTTAREVVSTFALPPAIGSGNAYPNGGDRLPEPSCNLGISKVITIADIQHHFTEWQAPPLSGSSVKGKDFKIRINADLSAALKNFHAITGHHSSLDPSITLKIQIFAGLVEHEALKQYREGSNEALKQILSVQFDDGKRIYTRHDTSSFYWKTQYNGIECTDFITLIQNIYNCSYFDALDTLASVVGMSYENAYAVYKGEQHTTEHSGKSLIDKALPYSFQVNVEGKQETVILDDLIEIKGFRNQTISGIAIYRLGNRIITLPVSTAYRTLTIGKHKAPAHFYNQSKIDSNPEALILLCQSIQDARVLDEIFKNSPNIVVSAHYGHNLEPLPWNFFANRKVFVICAVSQEHYARVEAYKNKLTSVKVKEFSIFPFPMLLHNTLSNFENNMLSFSMLEQELLKNAIYLKDISSEYLLLKHISDKALAYDKFKRLGQDLGIFIKGVNTEDVQASISPTFSLTDSKNGAIKTFSDVRLSHILPRTGLILICGKKGVAKTLLLLSLTGTICSGGDFLDIKGTGIAETLVNYDTESMPEDFSSRIQQLELTEFMDSHLYCLVKSSMADDNHFYSFSLANSNSRNELEKFAQGKGAGYIAIDNLTTSLGDEEENTIYSQDMAKKVLDYGKNLNSKGIGFILSHHLHEDCKDSTLGKIRGSKEWFIRSHTILILIGAEEVLTSKKQYPEIVMNKCRSQGATIGIYFKACKLAGILERTILWAHLPYGKSDWELLAHTDMDGKELEVSLCTVALNSDNTSETIIKNCATNDEGTTNPPIEVADVSTVNKLDGLSYEEQIIVKLIHEKEYVETSDVNEALGCKSTKSRTRLNKLIESGVIRREGDSVSTKYFLA